MVHGHFNIRYTHSTFARSVQKYSSLFLYSILTSEGLLAQHTVSIAQLVPKMYLASCSKRSKTSQNCSSDCRVGCKLSHCLTVQQLQYRDCVRPLWRQIEKECREKKPKSPHATIFSVSIVEISIPLYFEEINFQREALRGFGVFSIPSSSVSSPLVAVHPSCSWRSGELESVVSGGAGELLNA